MWLSDGSVVGPLPLRYQGFLGCRRAHRMHRWVALAADHLAPRMESVSSDPLPARTALYVLFLPNALLAQALADV